MARDYNISWNKNQTKQLNSAVRKYNNALRRAARANPAASEFLPSEVTYKDVKSSITNARALKNTVNKLNRATRKGALNLTRLNDGSVVTNYEMNEFRILRSVRERNRAMTARRKGIEPPKKGSAGNLKQAAATPDTRKAKTFNASTIKRFIETTEREMNKSSYDKARRYFNNYKNALKNVFGGYEDFDHDVEVIMDIIKSYRVSNFDEMIDAIDNAPDIQFIYDPLTREAKMAKLMEYWSTQNRGKFGGELF